MNYKPIYFQTLAEFTRQIQDRFGLDCFHIHLVVATQGSPGPCEFYVDGEQSGVFITEQMLVDLVENSTCCGDVQLMYLDAVEKDLSNFIGWDPPETGMY
jgi:hypothetical protein